MKRPLRTAHLLLESVPRVMRTIRREFRAEASEQLTITQFRTLANLHAGLKTTTELAEWIGVSVPAASRLVDTLARKGLIRRQTDRGDRRQIVLTMTPQGNRYFKRLRTRVVRRFAAWMETLDPGHLARMEAGLEELVSLAASAPPKKTITP